MDHISNFNQLGYEAAIHSNPIFLSLCLFFLVFLLFLNLKLLKGKNTNFPPSPPKLPIIGNLHQLGTLRHQSLASLSKKYGPLMLLKLGQTPTLVVSSAKMAKEVMKNHDIKFSNRPQTTAANIFFYGCQDVGFAPYGEYWKQARKLCVSELLSAKRVESFQHVRDEEVGVLINRIRKACVGGACVNLSQLIESTSNNIVSRCFMGEKFEDEDGKNRFRDVSKKVLELFTTFCVADFFPGFGWVDVLRGFIGELKRTFKTMDDFFDIIVEEHKTKLVVGKSDHGKRDFVDIMLQLQQEDMLHYHFTRDNLKAIMQDLFIAGTDTISTALEWTVAELIRCPTTMKNVQEEVRTIVGKKPKIETDDISKMEYMKCVIKESLRLHPPAPLLVPRETSGTVNIEGYHVASGTSVYVNAWAIQRDPNIWERPNEFLPKRFMKKNSVDFNGQDFEFVPFGSGRRKCPGILFAIAAFECVLANLLCWFDWKLPEDMPGELLDMSEKYGITVHKKIPLHLKPLPYVVLH